MRNAVDDRYLAGMTDVNQIFQLRKGLDGFRRIVMSPGPYDAFTHIVNKKGAAFRIKLDFH